MAEERGMGHTFRATDVGAYFGEAGVTVPDPFFGGEGPTRGMSALRRMHGGLPSQREEYIAEKLFIFCRETRGKGVAEVEVTDVRPLTTVAENMVDGQSSTVNTKLRIAIPPNSSSKPKPSMRRTLSSPRA
jgi:hypothetical protein